jgi:1-acyl-sn-glycerol-3-phosphate acyltransferase
MNGLSVSQPRRRFDAWAFVRSLWKPAFATAGLVVAALLFFVASDLSYGFLAPFGAAMLLPWLHRFRPMSRFLGWTVLGSSLLPLCFAGLSFEWLEFGSIPLVFGVALGTALFGTILQYLNWEPRHNPFAVPPAIFTTGVLNLLRVLILVGWVGIVWIVARTPFNLSQYSNAAKLIGISHSVILFILCWLAFHRQVIELLLEPIVWILYAIRGKGPCAYQLPPAGPLLIVANHASWLDPVFLAKVLPRPITPMMTSKFYDIWFLRPLLKYVFNVIVVPDVKMRREAPELQLAIAALDRGEVVVIFPEGALRRKEEIPLKRFGQGVWMILRERPDTPVIPCWIEGAWGSYCSYLNGPPTKNKKIDVRRKIEVAVGEPQPVPEDVLLEGMPTRIFLMNRVLASRELLGLPPLPRFELPEKAGEVEE